MHILDNKHNDKRYFIFRILLAPPDSNESYILFRRYQFFMRLAFVIIINKSQNRSL